MRARVCVCVRGCVLTTAGGWCPAVLPCCLTSPVQVALLVRVAAVAGVVDVVAEFALGHVAISVSYWRWLCTSRPHSLRAQHWQDV